MARALQTNGEDATDQHGKQRHDQHDPDQTKLLGQHGEDEIGVCLGQVVELLYARTHAHPGDLAATDRDQRLGELEAAVERIGPGVDEGHHALQPVGLHGSEGQQRQAGQTQHEQVLPGRAGQPDHAADDGHQHHGRPHVRLLEQDAGQQADDQQGLERLEESIPPARDGGKDSRRRTRSASA
jgi:hypothetical protein